LKSRIVVSVFVLLAFALVLMGCGGGGGGGIATTTPDTTTASVRQIAAGDRVVYSLSGTTRAVVSGTMTITTSADAAWSTLPGRHLQQTASIDLSIDGKSYVVVNTIYLSQSTAGAQYHLGSEGAKLTNYVNDPIAWPSPITTGQTWNYTSTYSDGSSETVRNNVIGAETVSGVSCYKIECTTTSTEGNSVETDWFAPGLGYPVKSVMAVQVDATTRLDLIATLTSKNF